jgi:hypothetical protein
MKSPGPWTVGHIGLDEFRKTVVFFNKVHMVAEVLEEEDAKLIAAAPELLEVCQGALAWLEAMPIDALVANQPERLGLDDLRYALTKAGY